MGLQQATAVRCIAAADVFAGKGRRNLNDVLTVASLYAEHLEVRLISLHVFFREQWQQVQHKKGLAAALWKLWSRATAWVRLVNHLHLAMTQ